MGDRIRKRHPIEPDRDRVDHGLYLSVRNRRFGNRPRPGPRLGNIDFQRGNFALTIPILSGSIAC